MPDEVFPRRMDQWRDALLVDIRKKWWWGVILVPLGTFGWALLYDRVIGYTNRYIDAQIATIHVPTGIASRLGIGALLSLTLVIIALLTHSYFVSSRVVDRTIDGEAYRIALNPRTAAWEMLRDIYRVSGRPQDARIDCDFLIELYLVNPSPTVTRYVREFRLSVDVDGQRVQLERQNDLRAPDFASSKYEYGLREGQPGERVSAIKQIFTSLPFPLLPEQPVEGWLRFLAKDINPDKVGRVWQLSVIDSLGVEHPITKIAVDKRKGEIGLRNVGN